MCFLIDFLACFNLSRIFFIKELSVLPSIDKKNLYLIDVQIEDNEILEFDFIYL